MTRTQYAIFGAIMLTVGGFLWGIAFTLQFVCR